MMIILQLILYCGLFILLVRLGAIGGGMKELYFYPKEFQKIAFERGLADEAETQKNRKCFMIPFVAVMFLALVLIVGLWNRPSDFPTAYLQSLLFLQVMNWFDGIVIDELWVGCSSLWKIPGMEGIPYTKPWSLMCKQRILISVIYIALAVIPAGIAFLIGRL